MMMRAPDKPVLWTAHDAADATSGKVEGDWTVTGVSIDTRTLERGDLFIALSGPNHDGHDFVATAFEAGAAAAMVTRVPDNLDGVAGLLIVDDVEEGLRDLARAARARTTAKIIGVTGSVGKTGTKEMLNAVFAKLGRVSATAGNLNNHYGLPLSLARMPQDTEFGIFEMGMNHAGEITELSKLARPHIAIITAVAAVHIEFFESVEGIADAKAEIFDGLESGGTAILNRDNEHFQRINRRVEALGVSNVVNFGANPRSDIRLKDFEPTETGSVLRVNAAGVDVAYDLHMRGRHWAMNSLAVLAALHAVGADVAEVASSLADVSPTKGRGQLETITFEEGDARLIDETYNASPVAVRAAFDVLADTVVPKSGRRIVVLGDMLELGDQSEEEHRALAQDISEHGLDLVFACGPFTSQMYDDLPDETKGAVASSSVELAPLVAASVRSGDVVLIKGSAGSNMNIVANALRNMSKNSKETREG